MTVEEDGPVCIPRRERIYPEAVHYLPIMAYVLDGDCLAEVSKGDRINDRQK
jgi:hypothetical protein